MNSPDLVSAFGRLHPLLIHFPIGLIAGVVALELWTAAQPAIQLRTGIRILLYLGAVAAVSAAICGLFLAQSGQYDAALLFRHRLCGVATVACSAATLWLQRPVRFGSRRALFYYRLSLASWVIVMSAAAHYGGILTHGSKSPFGALAGVFRSILPHDAQLGFESAVASDQLLDQAAIPILESRCYECHGQEKQKHGLRLDSRAAALAGGESGNPAVVPGDAMASTLVKAITLPVENKRAMPPAGKRRLEPREVLVLIDWINHGAEWPDKLQLRPAGVNPPSTATIEALNAQGVHLSLLARGHPLVRVEFVPNGLRLAALRPIAEHIGWLHLDGFTIEPGELRVLADMPHLTRLDLAHSNIQDGDMVDIARLGQLAVLNVYATRIGDVGLDHLRDSRSLERVYLWQTHATPAGIARLRTALPGTQIDDGDGVIDSSSTQRIDEADTQG